MDVGRRGGGGFATRRGLDATALGVVALEDAGHQRGGAGMVRISARSRDASSITSRDTTAWLRYILKARKSVKEVHAAVGEPCSMITR